MNKSLLVSKSFTSKFQPSNGTYNYMLFHSTFSVIKKDENIKA